MLLIMSNDHGKATIRDVIPLAALILGSGMLVFNDDLSGAVFRSFGIMVFEGGIYMVF